MSYPLPLRCYLFCNNATCEVLPPLVQSWKGIVSTLLIRTQKQEKKEKKRKEKKENSVLGKVHMNLLSSNPLIAILPLKHEIWFL